MYRWAETTIIILLKVSSRRGTNAPALVTCATSRQGRQNFSPLFGRLCALWISLAPFLASPPVCFLDVLGVAALWPPVYFLVLGVGTQCMEVGARDRLRGGRHPHMACSAAHGASARAAHQKEKGKRGKWLKGSMQQGKKEKGKR